MSRHTVKQVAKMAGTSVRALHHYDQIGLLKPEVIGENGYRYYGREELLKLQQILTWRELDFSLEAIAVMLADPSADRRAVLEAQRDALAGKAERYGRLIATLDATLADLKGEKTMDDETIFDGYDAEKQAEYEYELIERWGEDGRTHVEQSRKRMAAWSRADKQRVQAEMEAVHAAFAAALEQNLSPDSADIQAAVERHHAWLCNFWTPNAESYQGLGVMYRDDPRFRATYDAIRPGLAPFLAEAMAIYARRNLS